MSENSFPITVFQVTPAYAYPVDNGYIYVYLVKTWYTKMAMVSFFDGSREHAFAVQTITSSSPYEADMLIREADKACVNPGNNQFSEMLEDDYAMTKLSKILAEFYNGD